MSAQKIPPEEAGKLADAILAAEDSGTNIPLPTEQIQVTTSAETFDFSAHIRHAPLITVAPIRSRKFSLPFRLKKSAGSRHLGKPINFLRSAREKRPD